MNIKGILFALLGFAMFSVHDVVVKYLGAQYSPIQILFFAGMFSFPLVTFLLISDPTRENLRPVHPWWVLVRVLASLGAGLLAFYAFSVLPLAQTYTLLFAAPMLITVLAIPVLGESVGPHRWAAVSVGLVGVIVVLRPGGQELNLGHLAAVGSAACNAMASIAVRKVGKDERAVVLLLYPLAGNFILMGSALPFVYVPMPIVDFGALGVMAVLGFFASMCIIGAYRFGEAAIVAPMQYSQILWATFFGFLLFGESLDQPTMIGAGLIILSGLYIVYRESRGGTSTNTPVLRNRTRGFSPSSLRISPLLRRWKDN
ncbi:DMT family transporter [Marinovum sp. 2_MG-2023]|uniref:DMT family transporter n=1 Tax=Roseobacteraceae TaxID=2854170 RepID=UPI001FD029C0|nr:MULTISPECIES: DMT family transporter [Roseobacteraceae]MCJ7871116.1 DMT family transporter [Phaeobacter sp. J2-8]MDO6729661.1 DMT family transporter [Marinovum sp. 2_MG-2023]MDO6779475.1 DMT family transporter [Marinovum sp. 1_MG-2023]